MALDADTGKVVWEYKFNVFQSDVPPHRVGWASPAADPETGNIYAMGVGATVIALNKDGKLLWDRSIGEEFAAFTTHGGRTISPHHRRQPGHRQRRDLELGHAARPRSTASSRSTSAPATSSGSRARRPALRHQLRGADDRHDQRHAAAHQRQRRRRRLRDEAADRREGLGLRHRQARDQHRRRRSRATPSSSRTATRTSTSTSSA